LSVVYEGGFKRGTRRREMHALFGRLVHAEKKTHPTKFHCVNEEQNEREKNAMDKDSSGGSRSHGPPSRKG